MKMLARSYVWWPGLVTDIPTEWLQGILKCEGDELEVVVHVGSNGLGKLKNEVLHQEIKELGSRLKSRTSMVIISGLLSVPRASEYRNRKIGQKNAWLKNWCRREGFRFLATGTAVGEGGICTNGTVYI